MINKNTILNYDANDGFNDHSMDVSDYIYSYHSFCRMSNCIL